MIEPYEVVSALVISATLWAAYGLIKLRDWKAGR